MREEGGLVKLSLRVMFEKVIRISRLYRSAEFLIRLYFVWIDEAEVKFIIFN